MISFQEATKEADKFIKNVYSDVSDTMLEEIETDDQNQFWFITLSFVTRDDSKATGPLASLHIPFERKFKTLIVDTQTGKITKMKIWPPVAILK